MCDSFNENDTFDKENRSNRLKQSGGGMSPVFSDKESALVYGLTRISNLHKCSSKDNSMVVDCSTPKPEELLQTLLNNEEIIDTLESFVKKDDPITLSEVQTTLKSISHKSSSSTSSRSDILGKVEEYGGNSKYPAQSHRQLNPQIRGGPLSARSSIPDSSLNESKDELCWLLNEIRSIADCLRQDKRTVNKEREHLQIWNLQLREREDAFTDLEVEIGKRVHIEVEKRLQASLQLKDSHLKSLENNLEDLNKENARLKESFHQMRQTNESLRNEVNKLTTERDALTSNVKNLQGRLIGLKRKINTDLSIHSESVTSSSSCLKTFTDKCCQTKKLSTDVKVSEKNAKPFPRVVHLDYQHCSENLSVSLEFLNQRHLRFISSNHIMPNAEQKLFKIVQSDDIDLCLKNLPGILELLITMVSCNSEGKSDDKSGRNDVSVNGNSIIEQQHNIMLLGAQCLEFIYWTIGLFNMRQIPIRGNCESSVNNLARLLYRQNLWNPVTSDAVDPMPPAPNNTTNLTAKMKFQILCCLFLLRVLKNNSEQESILVGVKGLLRSNQMCEYVDSLGGLSILLALPSWVSTLLDCLLCLVSSSQIMDHMAEIFLHSSRTHDANENDYFTRLINLLNKREDKIISETKLQSMEKAAVLLQKLSKIQRARELFDEKVTVARLKSLQVDLSHRSDTKFLHMNLTSIIQNLNADKIDAFL